MKYLTAEERQQVAGEYFAPEGLYEYTKSLPFLGRVKSNTKTLVAGEWTELVLDYEVGASGLADGAWIKATFKFYSVREFPSVKETEMLTRCLFSRIGLCFRRQTGRKTTMLVLNMCPTALIAGRHLPLCSHWVYDSTRRVMKDLFRKLSSWIFRMGI